jgi:hypothetical protein
MTNEENNSNKGIGLITGDPKKSHKKNIPPYDVNDATRIKLSNC